MALLIAVTTAFLFSAAPHESWTSELGHGDDKIDVGHHDVPVVSRQQDRCDSPARRGDQSPARLVLDDLELRAESVFAAWPLPASHASSRSRHVGGWYARGPPRAA